MQFNMRNVCLALIAIAMFSFSGYAQTEKDKTLAPYFFVQGDPNLDHLPLKDTRVQINAERVKVSISFILYSEWMIPISCFFDLGYFPAKGFYVYQPVFVVRLLCL